jgi:hypothetical protein
MGNDRSGDFDSNASCFTLRSFNRLRLEVVIEDPQRDIGSLINLNLGRGTSTHSDFMLRLGRSVALIIFAQTRYPRNFPALSSRNGGCAV